MRGTEEWQTYLKNNSWEDSFLAGAAFEEFLADDLRTTSETLAGLQLGQGGAGYAAVGPWTFPSVLFVGLALSLIAAIRVESHQPRVPTREIGRATDRHRLNDDQSVSNRRQLVAQRQSVAQTAALLTGYLIAFERAGFVLSTFIYLVLQARILGSRHLRRDLIVALVISLLAFGLFDRLLQVRCLAATSSVGRLEGPNPAVSQVSTAFKRLTGWAPTRGEATMPEANPPTCFAGRGGPADERLSFISRSGSASPCRRRICSPVSLASCWAPPSACCQASARRGHLAALTDDLRPGSRHRVHHVRRHLLRIDGAARRHRFSSTRPATRRPR